MLQHNYDYIVYHDNCWDGATAAYIASLAYPDAKLYPMQYGYKYEKLEFNDNSNILVVDFSFRPDDMIKLVLKHNYICVMDHHKTAIEDLDRLRCELTTDGKCDIYMDINRSGAMLAYDLLGEVINQKLQSAEILKLRWFVGKVQDRDLWIENSEYFEEFNAFMGLYPKTVENVGKILKEYIPNNMIAHGKILLQYKLTLCEQHVKHARFIDVPDLGVAGTIFKCSCSGLVSDICSMLLKKYPDRPISIAQVDLEPGVILYQLRSTGNTDASAFAKKYGGGGHLNAAAFSIKANDIPLNHYDLYSAYSYDKEVPESSDKA